jgi:prevent-host-death family protein
MMEYAIPYKMKPMEQIMTISSSDVISMSQARANLSELADQVKAGAEKIVTKNGESYIAIIDAQRLDYYHRLERERIHLLLLDDATKGLADISAGKVKDARRVLAAIQRRRTSGAIG